MCLSIIISILASFLWWFVHTDYFRRIDTIEFKNPFALKPLSIRKVGKYPHYDSAKFILPSGEVVERQINLALAVGDKFCFSYVYKNKNFIGYQIVNFKHCV